MTASEELLGMLHQAAVATALSMLSPRKIPLMAKGEPVLDDEGMPVMVTVYPTAAELAAATTLLKNNNITCAPSEGGAVDELQKKLDARRARRGPIILPDFLASGPELH